MELLTVSLVLFLIMDPIGNIASFLTMVKGIEPKKQKTIVIREMLIALAFMILFNYIGEYIFVLLDISETTVKIASGVILFIISVQILFPQLRGGMRENIPEEEPFIIPLAIPLIAGPSLLATIMLYAHMEDKLHTMLIAILIAWIAAVIVLLPARFLHRVLGVNGLMACEKLMGMVLVLLAVQRFLDGVSQCVVTCTP
jgi:multiple antibiotic resistance protein